MNAHSSRPTRTSAHLRLAIASLLACTAAPASIAFAQSTDTLDQIIVSATRRDEDVQRVPVAVSILSGADLERANRTNVNSIASQVPTVNFRTQSSNKDTSLFIRGVGTISTSPGVESSVSTVIDGVVYGARGQATLDLLDIERVEILRGPQGTLFGKNASAGVISIVTRAPSSQPGGFFDLSYFGGGDEIRVRSGVAGQLSKSVSASFSGLYATYDGNVKNVRNGENVNGYRHTGGRAKFQIEPSDDLRITLSADYVHSNDDVQMVITGTTLTAYPTGAVTHNPGFAAALGPVVPRPDNRSINSDMHTHVEDDNWGVAAQVDWQIGDYTLTSITAFRNWNNVQFQDGDRLGQIYQEFARSHGGLRPCCLRFQILLPRRSLLRGIRRASGGSPRRKHRARNVHSFCAGDSSTARISAARAASVSTRSGLPTPRSRRGQRSGMFVFATVSHRRHRCRMRPR